MQVGKWLGQLEKKEKEKRSKMEGKEKSNN